MATSVASEAGVSRYHVEPLDGRTSFGAIVRGLTLEQLDDPAIRAALVDLWIDKGVLVFRDGECSSALQVALSECFGRLERHAFPETWVDGHPELVSVKYYPDNGTCYEIDGEQLGGWLPWHSDLIYTDTINRGGILRPMQLPRSGGRTGFLDQIAAYDALPQELKDSVEGLNVVYVMDLNFANHKFRQPEQMRFVRGAKSFMKIVAREYHYPRVTHPLVFEQLETGLKVLNISPAFAVGIYEMGGPEGDDLLRRVIAHTLDPAAMYFHEWRQDDMVLWDNWRTLHSATGIRPDDTRVMQRTTIAGDYALGRALDGGRAGLPRVDI